MPRSPRPSPGRRARGRTRFLRPRQQPHGMEPAARARLGVPRGRPGRHKEVIGAVLSGGRPRGAPSGTIVYTNRRRTIQMPCSLRFVYTPASPRLSTTAQQPNSVHKRPNPVRRGPILPFVYTIAIPRPPTTQAHGATVYTNAPKQRRGAILANLCTLLRRRPGGDAHAALAVTQLPTHANSRSLLYKDRKSLVLTKLGMPSASKGQPHRQASTG